MDRWQGATVKQQQVHKWRRRLAEPEEYRTTLYGAAYAKAMAELIVLADRHCHSMTASTAWAQTWRG